MRIRDILLLYDFAFYFAKQNKKAFGFITCFILRFILQSKIKKQNKKVL
jgi:hypothetical protein